MFKGMRKYALGVAAAAALFVIPISAFSQSIEIGPGGVRLGSGECEQLRRACENKDVLGERAKEIAADIGRAAKGRFAETCAAN